MGIIEAAQANIENLNKNLTDFKNLFGDKSKRGKLGEEYLEDLVKDCLVENIILSSTHWVTEKSRLLIKIWIY